MAYARNNPNAQYDAGPNVAGAVESSAKTLVPGTATTSGLLNPNSNVTIINRAPDRGTFGMTMLNFGADQPITIETNSFSATVLFPTDSEGASTLTAAALVALFNALPNTDGLSKEVELRVADGETGTGLVDAPLFIPIETLAPAAVLDFVDSSKGVQSDGAIAGTNLRVGFNAAGVSRNNPGPNAAGAPR
jgi:hypothetical protein